MKTIANTKKILFTTACMLFAGAVFAQENKDQDLSRELTLEREYDPTVQDANKVNTLPVVREPEVKRTTIEYASYSLPMDPAKELYVLPSGKVMTDILYSPYKGYFNFGIGNYMNVNGDIGYHILNTEQDKLNIFFSHRSTNGKVKYLDSDEKVKAKLNDNLGGVNYKHTFTNLDLKLGARYGYSGFNYYGMPDPVSSRAFDAETYQGNQQVGVQAGIISHENDPFGYLLDVEYVNFSNRYSFGKGMDGLSENNIGVKGGLNTGFGGNQLIGLDARLDFFAYNLPNSLNDRFDNYAEVTVSPYYKIRESNLEVKLGVNVMFITGDHSKFFVSPNIYAQTEFVDKTVLYFDANGRIESNSAYRLSQLNRYIDPTLGVAPSRTWLDATLGIKSGIVPGFWFNVFAGYKITDDDVFFIQQTLPSNSSTQAVWGNVSQSFLMNSKVFKGGVELKYAYQKLFDVYLKTVYSNWNVDTDYKAYGKPDLEFMAGVDIRPVDKLTVSADYRLAGGRYGMYCGQEVKMKNINELNLTGTYAINNVLGVYLKINNALGQKYEYLPGYPLQGFSIMGGVNLNF
ncbi:MAG: TonB-dependent receptor [Tannerellaceae bacterium]|nr:TonB-dependent receptor [Tannerellaceae bacterium]